ncbi:MAG TPA: AmmeMemoRadiSam system protein A [Tepidisphaeraceae bacterium]|nr:AmmeMemoRadiSam system protein A [Tepidisphaeraceae bacterium]
MQFTAAQSAILLDTARDAIRAALAGHAPLSPTTKDPALLRLAGCFVSLHRLAGHGLRGCVGRLDAVEPVLYAVASGAPSVLRDPRFRDEPVTLGELPELELELSILSPLQPAARVLDFEPLADGIVLSCQGRTGCFLPQVARETGWSREQLLSRLCTEKMGLPPDAWQQAGANLSVFKTLIIGPEPFEAAS